MKLSKRLYIFTGKGGVGKTTLACSFSKYLSKQGNKVSLAYFQSKSKDTDTQNIADEINVNTIPIELLHSCEAYIAKKLKSKTIAKWIIKTPFFTSLINMIPGFSYLIFMGQILELLHDDPELIIVLDSPSSGHAITMIESVNNFNQIFTAGILNQDISSMKKMLKEPNTLQVNIITLPTVLAINEAIELKTSIMQIEEYDSKIFCNSCLPSIDIDNAPESLLQKIKNESVAIDKYKESLDSQIPFISSVREQDLIKDLVPSMENLV